MGKWFPEIYETFMAPLEKFKLRSIRKGLIQKATGHVLEIGSGTGFNFPYYKHADKVVAIEPNPVMRQKSLKRVKGMEVPIDINFGDAEVLPFPDDSFDTIVGTLVLCTIPDPEKALYEMRRVCKPNGKILFFEHVRVKQPLIARAQNWMTPLWKRVCDGCHLNRDSLSTIKNVGITVDDLKEYNQGFIIVIEATN